MIYIIDYGLKDLFEIRYHSNYGSIDIKIEDQEFTLSANNPMTISSFPTEILLKTSMPSQIIGYETISGETQITVETYKEKLAVLKSFGSYDDDGNFIFETREDKTNYDAFTSNWKPIYSEQETIWETIEYKIIYKQYVDEYLQPFITSQIVIPVDSFYKKSDERTPITAICEYKPNFTMLFRQIANKFGFVEVEDKTFLDNTIGKKYSIHDGIKYSKCNGQYLTKYFENRDIFRPTKGTYDDCVKSYNRDYDTINSYIQLQIKHIEGKGLELTTAKIILDLILDLQTKYHKIDSMKSTRDEYRQMGKLIKDIETKLLNI